MDKAYVRESEVPFTLRLHQPGSPVTEMAIFMSVQAYLYGLYSLIRYLWLNKTGAKVKNT